MKLSIVVPSYNSERYISETLDSIKKIKNENVELIIIDGGSTDNTLKIIESYKAIVDIVISEPDKGVPDALNKGFGLATGDIYCWLNSDDIYLSDNFLPKMFDSFDSLAVGFVFCNSVVFAESGLIQSFLRGWQMTPNQLFKGSNIFTGSLFFSRQTWVEFGKFDLRYNLAFEYQLLKFLFLNFRYKYCDCYVGGFRNRKDALSKKYAELMTKQRHEVFGCHPTAGIAFNFERFVIEIRSGKFIRTLRTKYFNRHIGKHISKVNFNRVN